MSSGMYNRCLYNLAAGLIDWEAHEIRVMLMTASHSFNPDDNVKGDVDTNDIGTKTVYVAGGTPLANASVTQGVGAGATKLDADDHEYGPGETLTARHLVLWDDSIPTDDLLCSIDFGEDKTCTDGSFIIRWDSAGVMAFND